MRHKVAGRSLGRSKSHRKALFRNQVTELLSYEKIKTTEAKAKEIRPITEKMITLGKDGSLDSRRQLLSFIYDNKVVDKVIGDLAKRYSERNGGYTRSTKLGRRLGDGANMVQLELIT
jgi:large subunit ribosomal protein L17